MLKKIAKWFLHLLSKKEVLKFRKQVFNWKGKRPQQIYRCLELEVARLEKANPGFKLHKISEPLFTTNGGLLYTFTFKGKKHGTA